MKKFLLLLATLTAAAAPSFAQAPDALAAPAGPQQSPDQLAARRAQHLAKELGLSTDQQARLQPVLLAQRQEMTALREQVQASGRQRGMGQAHKESQARYEAQLKEILTPEQYARFGQLQDEQRNKLRERRQSGQRQGMAAPAAR